MITNVPGFHGMSFEEGNAFQAPEPGKDLIFTSEYSWSKLILKKVIICAGMEHVSIGIEQGDENSDEETTDQAYIMCISYILFLMSFL